MVRIPWVRVLLVTLLLGVGGGGAGRAQEAVEPRLLVLDEGLRLSGVSRGARSLLHEDAVEARIVAGTWAPPKAGDAVVAPDGATRTWEAVTAARPSYAFEGEGFTAGTYLSFRVPSATERVALLDARGHDFVYVNGELRPGDPYGYGWLRLPVLLRAGVNELLFRVSRGRLVARLEEPPADVFVLAEDATLPTCEPDPAPGGRHGLPDGAVVVVNARRDAAVSVRLRCALPGGRPVDSGPASVPALSARKVPVTLPEVAAGALASGGTRLSVTPIASRGAAGGAVAPPSGPPTSGPTVEIPWAGAAGGDPVRRRTFVSGIDGSVQSYATCEPRPVLTGPAAPRRALVLSLHGAGVDAAGQAASYAPKPWATIVCPTNRRPFGFDWEAWGRLDALEVLDVELASGRYDAARVHVTGHSMGGHGTWHLGTTYPDRFATVAPSAGWRTFATYGGGPSGEAGPVESLLRRASSAGDVPALASNLATKGVYVLHGDADDNVPVTEARAMVDRLSGVVADLHVHEQAGAGHWWDASPQEPGADCVDWAPMLDLMSRRRVAGAREVREVDFATASPGVSASCAWVEIESQERMHVLSRVRLRLDPGSRRITGTTENVRALVLRPDLGGEPVTVALDGGPPIATAHRSSPAGIRLERRGGAWSIPSELDFGRKGPHRYGPFQEAFRHRFVLVVGTTGTPEENAWAASKARLDAEAWWYRGNGTARLLEDRAFLAQATGGRAGENVILYGHADMNAAWGPLLAAGPVHVGRGVVRVGEREVRGEDLACLFVRPRAGTYANSVGVVAGTGLPGLRLTDRLPYLASGVAVPDLVVLATSMLTTGVEGLVGAGFFGPDWSVESGEFAWR